MNLQKYSSYDLKSCRAGIVSFNKFLLKGASLLFLLIAFTRVWSQAQFTASQTQGCAPLVVQFSCSDSTIVKWMWDFGNGNTSELQNPSAIFSQSGLYSVRLVTENNLGVKDTFIRNEWIEVFRNPIADFESISSVACLGKDYDLVNTTVLGNAGLRSVTWDMGDGSIYNTMNASHVYNTSGHYSITLMVVDSNQCSSNKRVARFVEVKPLPEVDFVVNKEFDCMFPASFTFSDRTQSQDSLVRFRWLFSNGDSSFSQNPVLTVTEPTSISATLWVTDNQGCEGSFSYSNMASAFRIRALFNMDQSSQVCSGNRIRFSNLSTPNRNDIQYLWRFGDGTSSTQRNPTKVYSQPGSYSVSLLAYISNSHCIDTMHLPTLIDVVEPKVIKPVLSDSVFCSLPNEVFFSPSDSVRSAFWSFSSSPYDTSSMPVTSFLYHSPGSFDIRYRFTDVNNCISEGVVCSGVQIKELDFDIVGQLSGCIPFSERFVLSGLDPNEVDSIWWFVDGIFMSDSFSLDYEFIRPGEGEIQVVVQNTQGCSGSKRFVYSYGTKTQPEFEPVEVEICFQNVIVFKNLTDSSKAEVTSLQWIFEEGADRQSSWDGKHRFRDFTSQKVTLITFNYGCPDSVTMELDIDGSDPLLQGPSVDWIWSIDTCNRSLSIVNNAKAYTDLVWTLNGEVFYNRDSFFFELSDGVDSFDVKLWATNEDNMCPDDSLELLWISSPKLFPDLDFDGALCAPAELQFSNVSDFLPDDRFYWFVNGSQVTRSQHSPDEVISASVNMNYTGGETGDFNPIFRFGNSGDFEIKLLSNRLGCWDSIIIPLVVDGPKVDVRVKSDGFCTPFTVHLSDSLFYDSKVGFWDMGNGDTLFELDRVLEYTYWNAPNEGKVRIRYVEWDSFGCLTWKPFDIHIPGPVASFSEVQLDFCDSSVLEFTALSSLNKSSASYSWILEDDVVLHGNSVRYRFQENGMYEVSLVVKDSICESVFSKTVVFNEELLKVQIASDTGGAFCPPLMLGFYSTSIERSRYPITHYSWDFGDGTVSYERNPKKSYVVPGSFGVTLRVRDALGCIDSVFLPDMVIVNGPMGEFDFDKYEGCEPLPVHLFTRLEDSSVSVLWDLGDGNVVKGSEIDHVYGRYGRFIPQVVLTDTFGCQVALPQDKQIHVYANPSAVFSVHNLCLGDTTQFVNYSHIPQGSIVNNHWKINQSHFFSTHLSTQIVERGSYSALLFVESNQGCVDSVAQPFVIRSFDPDVVADKKEYCLGEEVFLSNKTVYDGEEVAFRWYMNGEWVGDQKHFSFFPESKGWLNVELSMVDDYGCSAAYKLNKYALVGDTLANESPQMVSVSVFDDFSVDVKHQMSDQVDFKSYMVYRDGGEFGFSLLKETFDKNDTVFLDRGLNTLSNVYCYTIIEKNICNYHDNPEDMFFHCTIDVEGIPDTNASIVYWNHYYGWDSVERYEVYRMVEGERSFRFLMEVPGHVNQVVDSSIVCRNMHYYRVLAIDKQSDETSWSDTCKVTPIYVNEVPRPEILLTSVYDNQEIEVYWDKLRNSRNPIVSYTLERSIAHANQFEVVSVIEPDCCSEHFSIVDNGSQVDVQSRNYYYRVKARDMCQDVSDYSVINRPILLSAKMNQDFKPELSWSHYLHWNEEVAYYEIEQLMPWNEFVTVGRTRSGKDTSFVHYDVDLNCMEFYTYRVKAVKMYDQDAKNVALFDPFAESFSNHADVEVESKLFAPNAFSPNGDNLNDVFEAKGLYIKEYSIKVFNRWAEQLYESDECMKGWDATFSGNPVPDGVYVVMIRAVGVDGRLHVFNSDVTVLR